VTGLGSSSLARVSYLGTQREREGKAGMWMESECKATGTEGRSGERAAHTKPVESSREGTGNERLLGFARAWTDLRLVVVA